MSTSPVQSHLAGEVVKAAEALLLRLEAGRIDGELYKLTEALKEQLGWLKGFMHHGGFVCPAPSSTERAPVSASGSIERGPSGDGDGAMQRIATLLDEYASLHFDGGVQDITGTETQDEYDGLTNKITEKRLELEQAIRALAPRSATTRPTEPEAEGPK